MKWIVYLFKTSLAQKKQDWAEYKNLKQKLYAAQNMVLVAARDVEHAFMEEDAYEEYDACLKKRLMHVRVKNRKGAVYESTLMEFQKSRCENFVPQGNECLCSCKTCGAYNKNKKYFTARQNLQSLRCEYNRFWKNKFKQK